MAASLAFYRRLGLEIPAEADSAPHVETSLPGGLRLAWDSIEVIRSFFPEGVPAEGGGSGGVGLAFLCDDPAAVDRLYAELTQDGYHGEKDPWDAPWGQRYAIVADPDGNSVDLFAPLG